ncbi:MAG: ribose-phosphate pyrophosphokinase-like domain-containing protein, partial [Clostridia bacterium]|nr:ribose-phosphate pyrophosphokinase-like domain-containing protein [Clostridia bacterium]
MVKSNNRHPFKIFSGNANRPLAEAIAAALGKELGDVSVSRFSDGEICVTTNYDGVKKYRTTVGDDV